MTDSNAKDILAGLNDECAALRAFVVLLEDEQRTLLGQHAEELQPLAQAKTQLADKIASLAATRRSRLPQGTHDTVEWLKKNAPQGLPAWNEARLLAAQAHSLNQTNGELIQIKLRYNQQAITALAGAAQHAAAGLYGADGQTSLPSSTRTLGSV